MALRAKLTITCSTANYANIEVFSISYNPRVVAIIGLNGEVEYHTVYTNDIFYYFGPTGGINKANDARFHHGAFEDIIKHYKAKFTELKLPPLQRILCWSDNCQAQFRGRINLFHIANLTKISGVFVMHGFGEVFGMKGVHDSAGKEASHYVEKMTSLDQFTPDAFRAYLLCQENMPQPKKADGYKNMEKDGNTALNSSMSASEAKVKISDAQVAFNFFKNLVSSKGSFGFDEYRFGFVCSQKGETFDNLKAYAAGKGWKHIIDVDRDEIGDEMITSVPHSTMSSEFRSSRFGGLLFYRHLSCWCCTCADFDIEAMNKIEEAEWQWPKCPYESFTGVWKSLRMTADKGVNVTVKIPKGDSKRAEPVFIDIATKKLKVHCAGGSKEVNKGTTVFYRLEEDELQTFRVGEVISGGVVPKDQQLTIITFTKSTSTTSSTPGWTRYQKDETPVSTKIAFNTVLLATTSGTNKTVPPAFDWIELNKEGLLVLTKAPVAEEIMEGDPSDQDGGVDEVGGT